MDLRKETRGRKDTTITKTESAEGLEREPSGLTFEKKKCILKAESVRHSRSDGNRKVKK